MASSLEHVAPQGDQQIPGDDHANDLNATTNDKSVPAEDGQQIEIGSGVTQIVILLFFVAEALYF
jgi:hypothetical protein